MADQQLDLIDIGPRKEKTNTSTFTGNMSLPVHRWFRYSAGFSAKWAQQEIETHALSHADTKVLDPFAGSGTTILASDAAGIPSVGCESHPMIYRVARCKIKRPTNTAAFADAAAEVLTHAKRSKQKCIEYPDLVTRCFSVENLDELDRLRVAVENLNASESVRELVWLNFVCILRGSSHAGTAQWQYVLPNKSKRNVNRPFVAFEKMAYMIENDLNTMKHLPPMGEILQEDGRRLESVADASISLVLTSPPYPNNYDYADATRLELMVLREIEGWSELQSSVRQFLVRSCSQHTTSRNTNTEEILADPLLSPVLDERSAIVTELGEVRKTKGGKKNYHLMIASYFQDLAHCWHSLRRCCRSGSEVCFVVGDSAPYGVYVPVYEWFGKIASSAGFSDYRFEKLRDRNIKWKNRKHRVPLSEGRFRVKG